ncbi:hypothetical protein V1277_005712 [Bradyrhizobium sp. AZCC 1588]
MPDAGADRMLSIEDMVWNSQRTLVSATGGRTLGQSQGASRQVRMRGCGLWDDLKASPFQRHFRGRNAPYALTDPCNPLISQQMRAPSERTKGNNPLLRKVFSLFLLPRCYSQWCFVSSKSSLFDLARLDPVLALVVVTSLFDQRPAKESHHLLTRGSGVAQRRNRRARALIRARLRGLPSCVSVRRHPGSTLPISL